jgi:penicillin-binding protein 1C
VPLSAISQHLVDATMAAEDRRFFEHQGVDWVGLVRALGQNAGSDGVASGASTLEMQLVRNLFMPDERTDQTLSRKAREAVAALRLNERYRKAELIETYLNSVYYANQSYGAEAAAQRYFGKPARDLTLPEAALLAGIPQNPSAHNPLGSFSLSKARQEHILDLMGQNGFITPQQAAAAKAARLDFQQPRSLPIRAPHWVNYVRELVRERFGPELLFTGGLRIHTTLDPQLQQLAERIVFENEAVRQAAHANNSSAVVIDVPTGQVLAMVGSKNFFDDSIDGQVNVTVAHRQPGSSIKPLVYLAGFEKGLNPGTEVLDTPTPFSAPPGQPPYLPENYEKKYYGRISLRDALGNSLNVPAVKVLKYAGVPHFQDLLRRLGITTLEAWDPRWLSLTLGGGEVRQLELTGAYATIARGGRHKPVEPLVGVETARGDVLYWAQPEATGQQAVDPRHAYQLLHVMGDPQARLLTFGPNTPLNINRPHMLKTGTTDDYRDTWTVGCLPQVCVGVWMGNTDNRAMQKTSSSLTAGKLWIDLVQAVAEYYRYPAVPFPVPEGMVVGPAPSVGGGRTTPTHEEVLLPGQRPRTTLEMNWMAP